MALECAYQVSLHYLSWEGCLVAPDDSHLKRPFFFLVALLPVLNQGGFLVLVTQVGQVFCTSVMCIVGTFSII